MRPATLSTMNCAEIITLTPDQAVYPALFQTHSSPPVMALRGNPVLQELPLLALFGSNQCPARLILHTHDLAQTLRQAGVSVTTEIASPLTGFAMTGRRT